MGIKMKEAYCTKQKRKVKLNEVSEDMREDKTLICKTKNCKAKLTWVKAHKRNSNIEITYFRLLSKYEHHASFWLFNISGRIKIITASSDNDIMKSLSEEQYEFRLNLLSEALRKTENDTESEEEDFVPNEEPKDKQYIRKGRLKTYLSTMNKVMELRSEINNDKELRYQIKLIFNNKAVTWDNFYFENDEYLKSYAYIEGHGKGREKKFLEHPICIRGEIINFEDLNSKGYDFYSIKFKPVVSKGLHEVHIATVN